MEENSRRKKKLKKIKKKGFYDPRLPSEEIYLQRIEAPHENKKQNIRKKRKKNVSAPHFAMDEENEVYDLDF